MELQKEKTLELQMKVLRVIEDRTIGNPITGDAIAEKVGSQWREVAMCISALRYQGFKIGSSKVKPMGYFIARTPEEIKETVDRMKQTCIVQLRLLHKMNAWNGSQPTLWEGDALQFVKQTLKEAEIA